MKFISPQLHSFLDYVVAGFLIVGPTIFQLSPGASAFSFILGGIHFLLTIVTIFRGGIVKFVPFRIHGIIEFLVSITLGILALTIFKDTEVDKNYYATLALSIMVVFICTDYKAKMPN